MWELLFINKNNSVYLWCKVVYNHQKVYGMMRRFEFNNNYLTGDYHKAMAQGFVIPVASVV